MINIPQQIPDDDGGDGGDDGNDGADDDDVDCVKYVEEDQRCKKRLAWL